jgi:ATP-binding cassette subfamily B protein RaxB
MGTTLSGGQKQRVLLARALYKKPKILFLDESTAHLDIFLEKRINSNIAKMKLTRIVIAHRPETINFAERVFLVTQEGCFEQKPHPHRSKRKLSDRRIGIEKDKTVDPRNHTTS